MTASKHLAADKAEDKFAAARFHMVESQLRPNKVLDDRILDAFSSLARERFVPMGIQSIAYIDEDVAVAPGRFLMEPMVHARLLQEAEIVAADNVLEIGSTTGYGAAVLASLSRDVTALEQDAALFAMAEKSLRQLGVNNVQLVSAPIVEGYAARAPYSVMLVMGAVSKVSPAMFDQLAEGGRLMVVVRERDTITGKACRFEKRHGQISVRELFDANTPYLPGFAPKTEFTF
jgi:protein-L-isoaspartate(D-aspartate) O-methyltransferase